MVSLHVGLFWLLKDYSSPSAFAFPAPKLNAQEGAAFLEILEHWNGSLLSSKGVRSSAESWRSLQKYNIKKMSKIKMGTSRAPSKPAALKPNKMSKLLLQILLVKKTALIESLFSPAAEFHQEITSCQV